MIVFFGKMWRDELGEGGTFWCPSCRQRATYRRVDNNEYLTVMGLRVRRLLSISNGLVCGNCDSRMDHGVLNYSEEEVMRSCSPWQCADCGTSNEFTTAGCSRCGARRPDLIEAARRPRPAPRLND